jgi:glycopeptide antibiotics resistance protein
MQKKLRLTVWVVFIVYALLLVKFVLLKKPQHFLSHLMHWKKEYIQAGLNNMILVPFRTTWICLSGEKGLWMGFENIAGNLLGFAPMGFFVPVLFVSLNNRKKAVATVFAISLFLELTQLFTGVGYFDIDDLIQNTLGGLIGYWLYKKWLAKTISINKAI